MSRNVKPRQKPSTKVGGGEYFDGNFYYEGAPPVGEGLEGAIDIIGRMVGPNGKPITKAEYDKRLKDYERDKARTDKFGADLQEITLASNRVPWRQREAYIDAELQKRGYSKSEITRATDPETGAQGELTIAQPIAPTTEKSNMMAQMAVPEYDLEGKVDMQPQRIEARRGGYDTRTERKIGLLGSKTNHSIDDMNAAKQEHINLIRDTNAKIGAPNPNGSHGWDRGSANAQYQRAMDKGADGDKDAKKMAKNADAYVRSIQADADARGAVLQKKFEAAGGQANQANRLSSIIGHLAQRQQANAASTAQQAQTTGLINSGTSAFDANQLPDNSIAGMMKA